jgi:hypothetical protein
MTYQWFLGTNAVLATTNSALCLTNIQPSQAGSYTVVVTNVYGAATSVPAILTVSAEPIIEDSPTDQQAMAGDTVNFSVVASGVLPMDYHWLFGTNVVLETTNSVLCLTNVQPWQAGTYTVVVTNVYGAATSAPAMLTVTGAPVILVSPANQRVWPNGRADFSVVAVGVLPMAYQWFFGTNAMLEATNSTLHLAGVQPEQMGSYTVVVTNIYGATTSAPAMLKVYPMVTLTNCNEADLRAVAAGGAKVTFACDGAFILTSTITNTEDVVLDGSGHSVTISGNHAVRVFVVGTNGKLTLNHLTIADGATAGGGAGLLNLGGTVNATDCIFVGNKNTVSSANEFGGGAIYNGGIMNLDLCAITNNGAVGLNLNSSLGVNGSGGAIFNDGALVVRRSTFAGNWASGGGPGSDGNGGAIYNEGTLWLENSTLANNGAGGATGVKGLDGGSFDGNPAGWPGGPGGQGAGSALFNAGNATAVNTTFAGNTAQGGPGGNGGNGGTFSAYGGNGGLGGNGGDAWGTIYDASGLLQLVNCTLANNRGYGGNGGMGGQGGLAPPGGPPGSHGGPGSNGTGTGGIKSSGSLLINTVLSANYSNFNGSITDGGHNLSSDASCVLTGVGSMNNTDSELGPLADNGGPTLTMALLAGSPAINAGTTTGAPATDQRGVPRPQGAGVDIGAFEYLSSPIFTGATMLNATNRQLQLCGLSPNQTLTLQVSTNLLNWWDATNFTAGPNSVFQCFDPIPGDAQSRFYRLKSGTP